MKSLRFLLCLPALTLCGTFGGTVTDLSGVAVSGAVVAIGTDSTTTSSTGTWGLARASGIAKSRTQSSPVASHLSIENGRVRLRFGGTDASGRVADAASARRSASSAAVRSAATTSADTIFIYWRGKRLVVLPVSASDSSGIVLKIDTAWSDDAGIPWNAHVAYGSLKDERDGHVYRTVTIGSQTWMAENLNYAVDSSWWFKGVDSTRTNLDGGYDSLDENLTKGARFGRFYTWTASSGIPDSCELVSTCAISTRGVCPAGWHLPDKEWDSLGMHADSTAGSRLRSTTGWDGIYASEAGQDIWGFRVLPAGALRDGQQIERWIGGWWIPSEQGLDYPPNAYYYGWESLAGGVLSLFEGSKTYDLPVRCVSP